MLEDVSPVQWIAWMSVMLAPPRGDSLGNPNFILILKTSFNFFFHYPKLKTKLTFVLVFCSYACLQCFLSVA
jgi:hypothetical protein